MKIENRKRNIPVRVWFSEKEYAELNRKAKIAGLPKSTVIRMLLCNYERKKNRTQDFMKQCDSFPPLATTSTNLR